MRQAKQNFIGDKIMLRAKQIQRQNKAMKTNAMWAVELGRKVLGIIERKWWGNNYIYICKKINGEIVATENYFKTAKVAFVK